ncbi:MAG TPA: secretion system protein [Methanoregulaceae archaeon]|nr:secretion system protein [Methanoregulaceae archaeon]
MTTGPVVWVRHRIHQWVTRDPVKFSTLRADMTAAHIGMTLDRYVLRSVIIAMLVGIIAALSGYLAVTFFLPPTISFNVYNPFGAWHPDSELSSGLTIDIIRITVGILSFLLGVFLAWFLQLKYPSLLKANRTTKINLLLHNAVSYMYAMQRGGAHMMDIFRSLSENASIYGEVAIEFRKIVRDADFFGYDMLTAMRNLIETTPSIKLKDFLQDLISVIESGGDTVDFLAGRVRIYQEDARFEQKQFLNTLQLVAEGYVTLFVAGPLFLIIILVVMGFVGNAPLTQLSVVIYLLIPIGSLVFILFIDLISIKTEEVERYIGKKWLHEFADVQRVKKEGEEHLFARLERYDRLRKVRRFIKNPFETFTLYPNKTFYVTVPLALVYVILVFVNTPTYLDLEVYIDVVDDHLLFALLIILIPFGIFYQVWRNRVMGIESGIPEFLNRLSGINQVGLTLAQSIAILVKANLGVLTYEIRRIRRDIDWGANVTDALIRFEERVRTPTIARTVTLITKASQMSGNIGEVLTIAAKDAQMAEVLKKERLAEMFIYTVIVYLVFFVFLFVVIVIDSRFLGVIAELQVENPGMATAPGALQLGNIQIIAFRRLFYHICLIQAFFSGLIAGQMGEASVRAGIKHAVVMLLITFVVFAVFL